MRANSSAPIIFLVPAVSGTCSDMTSHLLSSSLKVCTWVALPSESLLSMS
ncbi:Uncharacterised protein [Vibrio cholerae]|nr:Uncharacterised protein [Vibrio cholerae]